MPLVLMCGYPCSGKTRRAQELKDYFTENTDRQVFIVGDEGLGVDRNSVYAGEKLLLKYALENNHNKLGFQNPSLPHYIALPGHHSYTALPHHTESYSTRLPIFSYG